MKASELKPGQAVTMDGRIYAVVKTEHVKPGKGPAYAQVKLKDVQSGSNIEKRFGSTDNVEAVNLDRRECEFLYEDGSGLVFMDNETFDQYTIDRDFLGDAVLYLKPNSSLVILFHEGRPVTIELPASVELEVTETPPGIKGATATNQLKEATLETGLKTKVPPFIGNGDVVRIATEDGSYQSRA